MDMDIERKSTSHMSEETMRPSSQSRRRASKIITDAALDYERRRLRGITRSIAGRLSLKDATERRRAEQILLDAEEKAGLAALAWLREFNVPVYKACIYSASNLAKTSLVAGEATEFKFLSPKEVTTQSRNFGFLPTLEHYLAIESDLKIFWKQKIQPNRIMGRSHYVSNKGQYGPAQKQGTWRRTAQNEAKAGAVCNIARKYGEEEWRALFGMPEITEPLAKQWVQKLKTPNRIAMQILSHYSRRKPRTIKALLNKARKLSKSPF
jgi:hypothetical protein